MLYNNHELSCCIKSGFACSNISEQPLSIHQAVYNVETNDWTILLFSQSCFTLTVLLQGCWTNIVLSIVCVSVNTRLRFSLTYNSAFPNLRRIISLSREFYLFLNYSRIYRFMYLVNLFSSLFDKNRFNFISMW